MPSIRKENQTFLETMPDMCMWLKISLKLTFFTICQNFHEWSNHVWSNTNLLNYWIVLLTYFDLKIQIPACGKPYSFSTLNQIAQVNHSMKIDPNTWPSNIARTQLILTNITASQNTAYELFLKYAMWFPNGKRMIVDNDKNAPMK